MLAKNVYGEGRSEGTMVSHQRDGNILRQLLYQTEDRPNHSGVGKLAKKSKAAGVNLRLN